VSRIEGIMETMRDSGNARKGTSGQAFPPEQASDRERMRAIAAELAAALGQVDLTALDPEARTRIERARSASRLLTRLVDGEASSTGDAAIPDPDALPDLVGYRVLLSVRDPDDRVALGRMLAEMGARYELGSDRDSAHGLLAENSFDMAVIDDDPAKGCGRDLIEAIRARSDRHGRIPVLALGVDGSDDVQQALRDAGADMVLTVCAPAPFARAIAAIAEFAADTESPPDTLLLDHDRYRRLLEIAGEEGSLELLERLHEDLRQVERGLGHALAEQNPAEVRTQTHVLIALTGAVGADALQRLTESLNGAAHRRASDDMIALGRQVMRQLVHLVRFIAEQESEARKST
jgi:two-component system, OmpR family, aerobic respiration control sensor histidine kinase ArcB